MGLRATQGINPSLRNIRSPGTSSGIITFEKNGLFFPGDSIALIAVACYDILPQLMVIVLTLAFVTSSTAASPACAKSASLDSNFNMQLPFALAPAVPSIDTSWA
ncbi:hypothetical protein MSAN_02488400 [Mycena sanguinolenta]|uniref:Uncharacterized protein n=1 Tax=Mycena sanguinolenta TaxID=230812 RepID=A0A8H6WSR4_9AGAR|nr:hypothetical protein MSAN_02488400 [Mycena sanguinolenta]